MRQPEFLPITSAEMQALGWKELDILFISGDAYVDHPSFGAALLGRHLVAQGFRVGIVTQPRWQGPEAMQDLLRLGRPRLFAGITAGAIDSMLARYTAFRKQRSDDAYTPGGKAGARPNRAVIVYANLARQAFPGLPLVLGGIEASLRRASHYDFWSDSLRRSILFDAKADAISYGMGESSLAALAEAAELALRQCEEKRESPRTLFSLLARNIRGTAVSLSKKEATNAYPEDTALRLPSHEEILADPFLLLRATTAMERQVHQALLPAIQDSGERSLLLNTPSLPLTTEAMDALYSLPFSRHPHPSYTQPIPAWEMIRSSITSHRGCAGGCAFCSLALHQTRHISSRSKGSILAEARRIAGQKVDGKTPRWAGAISDVGGPSANMWEASCARDPARCTRESCLFPSVCPAFTVDQAKGAAMLREVAAQPGVHHVRVASGVRYDLVMQDEKALSAYTQEFTGGQLKVAPEHSADSVLTLMRKPSLDVFEHFMKKFRKLSSDAGKEQYVIPYLMSAYPGCTEDAMRELSGWLRQRGWSPRQVQCFIPTPGTVATAMFYCGKDPQGKDIPVARDDASRMRQHYLLLGAEGQGDRNPDGAKRRREAGKNHSRGEQKNARELLGKKRQSKGEQERFPRKEKREQEYAPRKESDKKEPKTRGTAWQKHPHAKGRQSR